MMPRSEVGDGRGDGDELDVVATCVTAQRRERVCHVEAATFRDHSLGLLDHDSAVQPRPDRTLIAGLGTSGDEPSRTPEEAVWWGTRHSSERWAGCPPSCC